MRKIRQIRLTNDFHRTEYTVQLPAGESTGSFSARTARRIRRTLCGCVDCTCGDALGQRGRAWDGGKPLGGFEATREYDGRVSWVIHE